MPFSAEARLVPVALSLQGAFLHRARALIIVIVPGGERDVIERAGADALDHCRAFASITPTGSLNPVV